jgi:hypothetical protein
MIEVQSGTSAPGLNFQDVKTAVEWAGLWGVAQTVMVIGEGLGTVPGKLKLERRTVILRLLQYGIR